jgi:hypothetical protein
MGCEDQGVAFAGWSMSTHGKPCTNLITFSLGTTLSHVKVMEWEQQ